MKDPLLFTPGPLTTSATAKAAMQRDIGSRDADFVRVTKQCSSREVELLGSSRSFHQ